MTLDHDVQRLLTLLDASFDQAEADLNPLDPGLVVYAESGWRVQDVVSHVLAWNSEVVRALAAYHAGGAYRIANFALQAYNQMRYETRRNDPAAAIYAEWQATRAQLKTIVAQMRPDQLAGEMTYPSGRRGLAAALVEEVMEHQREHWDDILAATKTG